MSLIFTFALLIGITLGVFGGGGGILTVPLLHYGLHLPVGEAIATSLIVICITSSISTLHYARQGQVYWREGLFIGASGIIGSVCGSLFADFLPHQLLLLILTTVMIASGIAMLCRRGQDSSCDTVSHNSSKLLIIASGFAIGLLTGMVGSGGGFLVVPALILLFNLPMREAVGTSLFVMSLNTGVGFLTHISQHFPNFGTVILISFLATIGTFAGGRIAQKLPTSWLRKGFAFFIITMALWITVREVPDVIHQSWYLAHPLAWLLLAIVTVAGLIYFLTRSCMQRIWRHPFFD